MAVKNWVGSLRTALFTQLIASPGHFTASPTQHFIRLFRLCSPKVVRVKMGQVLVALMALFAHSVARLRWSSCSSQIQRCDCCRDRAQHAHCTCLWFSNYTLNFQQFSLSGEDTWLSAVLHGRHSSLLCLGFQWEGNMVGVDLADGLPEIELECCIWSVTASPACHYQCK